ncbi:MAG TPA: tetratricopeptide repeat protein [Gemmataceae bacterium]
MRKLIPATLLVASLAIGPRAEAFPPRGGGGGGGGRPAMARPAGGGGGGRPSVVPQGGAARPAAPRPTPTPLPAGGSSGGSRPNLIGGGAGGAARPIQRPGGSIGGGSPSPLPSPQPSNRPSLVNPGQGGTIRPGAGGGSVSPGGGISPTRPGQGGGGEQLPNRPGGGGNLLPNRPGQGGGGEQWPNRPGGGGNLLPNRPGQGGGGEQWPNRPVRPINPDRPGLRPDRPIINNPNINTGNQGSINVNRPTINNNRPTTINQNNWTNINNTNINRPYNGGYWGSNGNWRGNYGYLHDSWYHGSWPYWNSRGAGWFAAGTALGWLASPGQTLVYSNPYYVAPSEPTYVTQYVDYSQPIAVPSTPLVDTAPTDLPVVINGDEQTASAAPPAESDDAQKAKEQMAKDLFDEASAQFKKGDYASAQQTVEKALQNLPGDAMLHEFRALTLFAQQKYQDAAAAVYAVLAAGPGWDWDTMKAFYPDADTYTKQLRALEEYQKANPQKGDASFLLAYHYLTLGSKDAAIKQLEHTVEVQPKDQIAAQLIKVLQQPQESKDRPEPGK